MAKEKYQEYLHLIGRLKDVYGIHADVDHQDIHVFTKDKRQIFKLFFGVFNKQPEEPSIVVSFHVDLMHAEAIIWFMNIQKLYPDILLHDSYIEDSSGETYLGEDAEALKEVYMAQEILGQWLENSSREEMEEFATSKVVGRVRDSKKNFDSRNEKQEAIIEFDRLRKPSDDDQIH
jgi:hypothetical protein